MLFRSGNELLDRAFALCRRDGDPTFNRENDYSEEEGLEDRHDETALIDGAPEVDGVAFFKVRFVTEPEDEKTYCYYEAGENNQEGILDSGYVAAGVVLGIGLCGLGGLLSFHNLYTTLFRSLVLMIE